MRTMRRSWRKSIQRSEKKWQRRARCLPMDVFNIYQWDRYLGPVTSVSRSDVNIIRLSIGRPRKSYWNDTTGCLCLIADGGNNQTRWWPMRDLRSGYFDPYLESLYDISSTTTFSISSFLKLIDLLGESMWENDQEFTSLHGKFHSQLIGSFEFQTKPRFCSRTLSSRVKWPWENQEKSLRPLSKKSWPPAGLKVTTTDYRKPQDLSKPICSCRLWWTWSIPS